MKPGLPAAAVLMASLAACGCGYELGPPRGAAHRSISVDIFRNETREREIEYPLAVMLVAELRARGWNVTSAKSADLALGGSILDVSQDVSAENPSDVPEAGSVKISVEIVLRSREGREIGRTRVSESGEFAAVRGESRDSAGLAALKELARAVVRGLETLCL